MSDVKKYTMTEVNEHKDKKSIWIVIQKSVYDVTKFLNEHPGGEEILLDVAGTDASEDFADVGHSSDAKNLMKKYKIGELA